MTWFRDRKVLVSSLSTFSSPDCLISTHEPTGIVFYCEILFTATTHMILNGLSVWSKPSTSSASPLITGEVSAPELSSWGHDPETNRH